MNFKQITAPSQVCIVKNKFARTYFFKEELNIIFHSMHLLIKNKEIELVTLFLRENIDEIIKERFGNNIDSIHIKINDQDIKEILLKENETLLQDHRKGLLFNYVKNKIRLENSIQTYINTNNIEKVIETYGELKKLKEPNINLSETSYTLNLAMQSFDKIPENIFGNIVKVIL